MVALSSGDTSEATVPSAVTIAAGQTTSPAFDIAPVHDSRVDGTQNVTLSANFAGHVTGSDTLDVTDDAPVTLTLAFGAGGASVSGGGTQDPDASFNIAATAASGFQFVNWTVSSGSATIGSATSATTSASTSEDTTLQANFATVTYFTVSYDDNISDSGSVPVDASSPYESGSTVTVLGNSGSLVRTGFSFEGWNTASDGSGTDYAQDDSFTIGSDVTLYANWNSPPTVDPGSTQTVYLTASVPWTPADISTTAWYDAADAGTITESSGAVSQWNDKSGNGNHAAQGSAADQPATGGAINGVNAIDFNPLSSTKQYLTTDLEQLTTVSIYLVIDPTARGINGYGAAIGANAAGHGQNSGLFWPLEQYATGTERNDVYYTDSTLDKVFCNGIEDSANHNFEPVILSHQGTSLPTANLKYLIGNRAASLQSGFAYMGLMGEIIICPQEHDLATRQKMEGYLAHKWSLEANLPVNHPYKELAPGSPAAVAARDRLPRGLSGSGAWPRTFGSIQKSE